MYRWLKKYWGEAIVSITVFVILANILYPAARAIYLIDSGQIRWINVVLPNSESEFLSAMEEARLLHTVVEKLDPNFHSVQYIFLKKEKESKITINPAAASLGQQLSKKGWSVKMTPSDTGVTMDVSFTR